MDNVIMKYSKQFDKNKMKQQAKVLLEQFPDEADSFLFDKERLSLEKCDDHYDNFVSAEAIYNEFKKIDDELYKKIDYSKDAMLLIMKSLLGKRYRSFKNVFDRKYKERPTMTVQTYLKYFKNEMSVSLKMTGVKRYKEGFSETERNKALKGLREAVIYFRAIDEQQLAHDIWKHYPHNLTPNIWNSHADTLQSPITKKKFIAQTVKYYAPRMKKKCIISKEDSQKLLRKTLKKLFL
ncbi:hypothetical protein ACLHDG_14355 [Sulfurovum sp. CS9]|uniref:hypothetical protein n=1 Tax=Sulfurovum sp. CS9 TaxID=3391146 RepID=UPI0039EC222A